MLHESEADTAFTSQSHYQLLLLKLLGQEEHEPTNSCLAATRVMAIPSNFMAASCQPACEISIPKTFDPSIPFCLQSQAVALQWPSLGE